MSIPKMGSSPILMQTTMLLLILTLCNDVSAQDLSYTIAEERLPNTLIGNIANDSDLRSTVSKDVFDQIRYNIIKDNSDISYSYFNIDNRTGSLYTTDVIDRESLVDCTFSSKCVLKIKVVAQSTVSPYFRKFDVSIEIEDINDNSPRFPKGSIRLQISEFAPLGSSVPLIGAVDIDSGNFSIKNYYIIPDNSPFDTYLQNYVDGTSLAKIVVRRELDRETNDSYTLTVVAEDGGIPPLSGNLTVNIVITDVNDNAPQFTKYVYNITVEENVTIGTLLVKLEAVDLDMGPNGDVIYRLSHRQVENFPELMELFSVDENSGELRLKGPLVFDSLAAKYEVIVEASDKGAQPLMSQAIVYVNVIDFNNNQPEININLFSDNDAAIISEYAVKGTAVAYIEVVDKDTGINAIIKCNITSDVFELQPIDVNEYKVIVKTALDRETAAFHHVTLYCEDKGTPPLNSSTSFTVQVKDENDNGPKFKKEIYYVNIDENTSGTYTLVQVSATDMDAGINGYVHYTVGSSNYQIYSDSDGIIWTTSVFDREIDSRITFNVFAIDGGIPAFTSTCTIVINVQDTNDNDPHFTEQVYRLDVAENLPSRTVVGQIIVTDQDIGKNGQIDFIIEGHLPFTIDSSGLVKTKEILDREIESKYNLIVIAFDHGVPSRSSTCSIVVNVTDKNDNSPIFVFPSVNNDTVVLPYSSSPWAVVTQIKAYDIDDGPNGQVLYSFVDTNVTELFKVRGDTGEIILLRELTLADKMSYYLQIRVDDQGQPSNFVTKFLNVRVTNTGVAQKVTESGGENFHIAISVGSITLVLIFTIALTICLLKRHGRKGNSSDAVGSGFYKKDAQPKKVKFLDLQINDSQNEVSKEKMLNRDENANRAQKMFSSSSMSDTQKIWKTSTSRDCSIVSPEFEQQLPARGLSIDVTRYSSRSTPQRVHESMLISGSTQPTTLQSQKALLQHVKTQHTKSVTFAYDDNDSQISVETIPSDSGRGGSESDEVHGTSLLQLHDFDNVNSFRRPAFFNQNFHKYRSSSANKINHFDTSRFQILSNSNNNPNPRQDSDFIKKGRYIQSHRTLGVDRFNNYENNITTFVQSEDFLNYNIVRHVEDDDDLSTTTSGSYTIDPEVVTCDFEADRLRGSLV